MNTVTLETPFSLKSLQLKNRVVMPPMCQYSAEDKDGMPTEWHYVHYVSRAVGGTGLIIMEMTNVEPDGRITDRCLGLWSDEHVPAFARIIAEAKKYGAKMSIQIAHAGRKAEDTDRPVAPSAIPVDAGWKTPRALTTEEVKGMVRKFADAARRAVEAGVDTIELHGAHGYLIHQFHSPSINKRDDEYGSDLALFGVEVVKAVKAVMPADMPLIMRISAIEYSDGGYDLDHAIRMASRYKEAGVDIFDISTGGEGTPGQRKPANTPGFQVPYAKAIKEALHVPVIAVGILENPELAAQTLKDGAADLIGVARGMLRDPYWAITAIKETSGNAKEAAPKQYERAL
jgi:NADPH2 dehydrogenase